ncbi:O-methyltransferase [Eubacteriales bacterium KG127]
MIRTDYVDKFICDLYSPYNKELSELRMEGEDNRIPIILRETEMYLSTLLPLINPKKILEIGSAIGYSTLFFSYMCPGASILSVEREDDLFERAKKNIYKFGKENQIFVAHSDAIELLDILNNFGQNESNKIKSDSFDLVFIDGAKGHYKEFVEKVLPITKSGSVIVCDNILMRGMTANEKINKRYRTSIKRMRKFLDFLYSIEGTSTQVLSIGDGISITTIK